MKAEEKQKYFVKRNYYTALDASKVFLYVLLLPLLFSLVFAYIGYGIASLAGIEFLEGENFLTALYENHLWFTIPYCLISQITFISVFFVYNSKKAISFSAVKLKTRKISAVTTLLSALFGIVFVVGLYALIEGCFGELFRLGGLESSVTPIPLDNFWWYLLNILLFAIIPAFCEEIIFRGVVQNGLRREFGKIFAIFISALLFALVHQNITQFIYPFIMGVVFSVVVECTGNLFYAMIMHLFNNITSLTIQYLLNIGALTLPTEITAVYVVVALVLALVTAGLFLLFYFFYLRKIKKEEEVEVGQVEENTIRLKKVPLILYIGIAISAILVVINAVI